ncbi:hypothetical protein AC578_162 [Pseudocercospora eumusae]|uniref:Uncharacterized protein n=1 Tax=Pseudocercospora eumusae TaxID=321146 RepID=A0A139H2K9_9PEZI|nr:hypothetical protein AC578_162 [Pseudocercospora eumusae]
MSRQAINATPFGTWPEDAENELTADDAGAETVSKRQVELAAAKLRLELARLYRFGPSSERTDGAQTGDHIDNQAENR